MRQGRLDHLPGMMLTRSRKVNPCGSAPGAGSAVACQRLPAPAGEHQWTGERLRRLEGAATQRHPVLAVGLRLAGRSTQLRPDRSLPLGAPRPSRRQHQELQGQPAGCRRCPHRPDGCSTSRWGKACMCRTTFCWVPRTGPIRSQGLSILNSMATAHSNTARRRWRTRRAVGAFRCQMGERISSTSTLVTSERHPADARQGEPPQARHPLAGVSPIGQPPASAVSGKPSGECCWLPAASLARLATRGISGQSGAPRRRTPFKGAGCGRPGTGGGGRVGRDRMRAGRPRSQGMPSGCAAGGMWGAGGGDRLPACLDEVVAAGDGSHPGAVGRVRV